MSGLKRKLYLEQMEPRVCPTMVTPTFVAGSGGGGPPTVPPNIVNSLTHLNTALTTAAQDFLNGAPVRTEIADAVRIMADTSRVAFEVGAATDARIGGMLAPLVSLEIDEATLYFDFATGDTAGAQAAAANEQTDLGRLGTALAGTNSANAGLAAEVFAQIETDFTNANDTLFGITSGSGGGSSGSGGPAA